MSEELKLKPCPFCGSEAEFIGEEHYDWFYIQCKKCKMRSAWQTREEAIEAWNRRSKN